MSDDESWKLQRHKNRVESLERENDSMLDTARTMHSYGDPVPDELKYHLRATRRIIGEMISEATSSLELAKMGAMDSSEGEADEGSEE